MSVGLSHWKKIWHELGAKGAQEALHERLVACWSEPHRHYHTLQHLRECLEQAALVRHLAQRPAEVELALWFHDAFYDPARDDNELQSAIWARDAILQAGLPADMAERLYELVTATRHEAPPLDADAQLLVDVDLSILGAEAARFDESDRQIRDEFAHIPDEAYRQGRRLVLESFLARPRLYNTDHFHAAREARARDNLQRSLARLAG